MPAADGRTAILDATVRLVIERGADAVRLADVAEAAGVSIGMISHHFRHRERLLVAAVSHEAERIASTSSAPNPSRPPLERLVEYVWLRTPSGSQSAATPFPVWSFWLDFWALAAHQPEVRAEFKAIYDQATVHLRAALSDGVATRQFSPRADVNDLAYRITAMIDGTAMRTLLGDIDPDHMLRLLIDGLCLELQLNDTQTQAAHDQAHNLNQGGIGTPPTRKR